ncbi:uncharacterized protein [Arachis hypogaea]|uniref:uncharacterized protein n=1 Tax=Arachis hypogaea TaxID=3818 RepID=UPI003B21D957
MSHLRPLHIAAVVNGFKINKVLIDGGAAISLLPERILGKVGKHFDELVPTNITVTDFCGNSIPARGLVTLTVKVGSSERHSVFVVVPSKASYNTLLGRYWIHGVGVVLSTVHQSVLLWTKKANLKLVLSDFEKTFGEVALSRSALRTDGLGLSFLKTSKAELWTKLRKFPTTCYDFPIACNETNDVSQTADLVAEAHCDPLEKINLGTHDDVQITYICKDLVDPFRTEFFNLLHEFKDCFAWDNHEIPGLDRSLVEYRLALKYNARPVKQTPRCFAPEINVKIKEEIECLIKAKFIRTARYVEWVLNVVSVMKKNGKLRVCIDSRDLNNATPKDEYFMPIADMLIDSAAGNEILSFIDGYFGYNQIFIAEDDVAKTAFRCPRALGTYEWVVMPFGLKNAGAYISASNEYYFS